MYNVAVNGEVACTLTSVTGNSTCSGPKVMVIDRAAFNQGKNAQYDIKIEESECMGTLVARGPHAVATGSVERSLPSMCVRRLTPSECERLQGFPDDHSRIPHRNKPADECAEGPRYKCLGNSMAVACMRFIGVRICSSSKTVPQTAG